MWKGNILIINLFFNEKRQYFDDDFSSSLFFKEQHCISLKFDEYQFRIKNHKYEIHPSSWNIVVTKKNTIIGKN